MIDSQLVFLAFSPFVLYPFRGQNQYRKITFCGKIYRFVFLLLWSTQYSALGKKKAGSSIKIFCIIESDLLAAIIRFWLMMFRNKSGELEKFV